MAGHVAISSGHLAADIGEFCPSARGPDAVAAGAEEPSQLFRIVCRTLLSFDVCPFCCGADRQRLLPDSYLDQGKDCSDSPADEMGNLGITAGGGAVHFALRGRLFAGSTNRSLVNRRGGAATDFDSTGVRLFRRSLSTDGCRTGGSSCFCLCAYHVINRVDGWLSSLSSGPLRAWRRWAIKLRRNYFAGSAGNRRDGRDRNDCRAGKELSPGTDRPLILWRAL